MNDKMTVVKLRVLEVMNCDSYLDIAYIQREANLNTTQMDKIMSELHRLGLVERLGDVVEGHLEIDSKFWALSDKGVEYFGQH